MNINRSRYELKVSHDHRDLVVVSFYEIQLGNRIEEKSETDGREVKRLTSVYPIDVRGMSGIR